MFTGIITEVGTITSLIRKEDSLSYTITFSREWGMNLQRGASVSVNGICQTVTENTETTAEFDAIQETLRCTNAALFQVGEKVNLERALRFGDEIGGHLVSGHISGLAQIVEIKKLPTGVDLKLRAPSSLSEYLIPKGFVALNGISLTVGNVDHDLFSCHLIPETLAKTNLSSKKVGDFLNIEPEETTKTIVETTKRYLRNHPLQTTPIK